MISFCFTHYNRLNLPIKGETLPLFKNCLSSLKNNLDCLDIDYEIVISSFDSKEILEELTTFTFNTFPKENVNIIPSPPESFTRGGGRQLAYKYSKGKTIAFIDTDMLFMRSKVIQKGIELTNKGYAYFPICYTILENGEGQWRPTGKGNCFVPKQHLQNVEWLAKKEWGREDDKFMDDLEKITLVFRDNTPGWYHQWHPKTDFTSYAHI
ncbi:hypothetical protein [uncultured virus]|jgi:glycosyltransferase involved in cell wall biosynthesis|uniref:Glycosyltransferase 2-like domain-containing protein n=1 Tax=uncultured virus TaxID=340016 RepID=A0A218MMA5_9VIRU|nr:hypothetical protein [uncultured virus]